MLTCIACSKRLGGMHEVDDDGVAGTPGTRQVTRALTTQVKDMAVRGSRATHHCKPCPGTAAPQRQHPGYPEPDAASESERYHYPDRSAAAGGGSWRSASTPRAALRREIEARLRALSSGDVTPSVSRRRDAGSVFLEEEEEDDDDEEHREWVAQVEPGVLITFVSLPRGKNDLRRIRFSRELFNRWQAQRWWAENCDKVLELYNVQMFHRQAFPLPTPLRSDDESSRVESSEGRPETPPLSNERLPRSLHRPTNHAGGTLGYSSSDSLDHHPVHRLAGRRFHDSGRLTPTPNLSSLGGDRAGTSSADASARTSSSSNAVDQEREWVERDEPGVYITIRTLPGGARELRRVRFSRERFGEVHARLWWEENRARILEQYL